MKVVFMGTPGFAARILKAIYDAGFDVLSAVSQPDKPKGRHSAAVPTEVRAAAESLGIPVMEPVRASDPAFVASVAALKPDVIVVAAYGKLLKTELLSVPRLGCVNVHASLLPRWRGAAPIQWALIEGDKETGVSTMLMNEGLDTGDILLKRGITIYPGETAGSLTGRLADLGCELIVETLIGLENGEVIPEPQPEEGAVYAPILTKEMGNIDWSLSAGSIECRVRGLSPWPGTYSYSEGRLIKIHEVSVYNDDIDIKAMPGTVFSAGGRLVVKCGTGALEVRKLQPEGRKIMSAGDFLRGNTIRLFADKRSS